MDKTAGHKSTVTALSYSQDGGSLASAASDGTFCLWNAENAILKLGPIHTPLGRINAIAYSPTAELVACAGAACYVGVWSTRTGMDTGVKIPRFFEAMSVSRISFSPNGAFIAVKADLAQDLLFIWAVRISSSSISLTFVMRTDTNGKKYAFHPSSSFICLGDKAWNLESPTLNLVSAEEGLRGILIEAFITEVNYRYEHGFDWIYVGVPPRQSFAVPNHFNVVCHAVHSRVAALGGEDGRVVFIDCHHLADQEGWRLSSKDNALNLDQHILALRGIGAVSDGGSSATVNANDFRVRREPGLHHCTADPPKNPNGSNYPPFPSESQTESQVPTFDSNSTTTSNVPCAVPDLTGSVHKLQKKPVFNGTYSTVYEGELDGKRASFTIIQLVNTKTQGPSRSRSRHFERR
jgi:WD40 repeat protein